jgi:type IV secretion system protein TrbL
MMVLYFILGMLKANAETFTWLGAEAQAIGSNISYGDVFNQMALIFLTALLVWLLPELAAGLLDGTPNMSAGSAVAGAGRAAGLGRTTWNVGKGGAQAVLGAGKSVANSKLVQKAAGWALKFLPH